MDKCILFTAAAAAAACCASTLSAQTAFLTRDSISINKINAAVLVQGDLWWDPGAMESRGYFPNGTRKSFGGAGNALWLSGYDGAGQLHVAAQTYRQAGNDYWPGPLDTDDTLTHATATKWAKIWKLNRTDIQHYQSLSTHTIANTHATILTWPAKGNTYAAGNAGAPLTITTDMAPFVDNNSNGIYEPLAGDYPAIKGDQALWWVFSDNGPTHNETNGKPLKVEVHAMCYAYKRGTRIDNVVYYDFDIINRSSEPYTDFRAALRADMDLGYYANDYIGFDSARRLGIMYNAAADDGAAIAYHPSAYDTLMPMLGITITALPGDAATAKVPLGSFTYYNNDPSVIGNPSAPAEYNNYMRAKTRAGAHFTNDFMGPGVASTGTGAGPDVNYVFPGDPSINTQWSECASGNAPGDRRFILSSGSMTLAAGATVRVGMALVITDTSKTNHCGDANFDDIKELTDTAWHIYANPLPPLPSAITGVAPTVPAIYPNPASNKLHIALNGGHSAATVEVYNSVGVNCAVPVVYGSDNATADITLLPAGVYYISVVSDAGRARAAFVKQ